MPRIAIGAFDAMMRASYSTRASRNSADNLTERHARGSELFALLDAAVHSSSCTPATTLLVFYLNRVPELNRASEGPSP